MAEPVNVGVDFGSLGWRAAYHQGEKIVVAPESVKDDLMAEWLWPEPSYSNGLGVAFPSLKSKLGSGERRAVNGQARTADQQVTEYLRSLKSRIEAQSAQPAGQIVVSVPASYSASRRAALRDAALKAGFTDAHLLNDSMAACICHIGQAQRSATLLVYSLGYAGFEIGLVRAVRGRYRTLGYEGNQSLSGAGWDETILRAWLACFSENNLTLNPPPQQWNASLWLQVRLAAQMAKEELSLAEAVPFPIAIQMPDASGPLSVILQRAAWEAAITPSIEATLDLVEKILAGANLTAGGLDAILLVGGGARCPFIPALLERRFNKRPIALEAQSLASGAAIYAMRLDSAPLPASPLGEEVSEMTETPEVAAAESAIMEAVATVAAASSRTSGKPLLTATPLSERQAQPVASAQDTGAVAHEAILQHLRRLIEQGARSQAELFMRQLVQDAQKLFESPRPYSPPPSQSAERAIARAYQLLKEGRLDQAVPQSHLAWQLLPDSPEVFDKMIDIHCQAAMAKIEIESYEFSIRWLECANSHDQGNTRVSQTLAERHYLHAKQLVERNRRKEALVAVEKCLYWNPEHVKGMELNATLSK